jgi:outer membrane cobalamin receptor
VKLSGKVIDADSGEPLVYATVSVLNAGDSSLITGAATDENGRFQLETNQQHFLVRIDYIAYQAQYFSDLAAADRSEIDLETIALQASETILKEVRVEAKKEQVEIGLDRKIFNVSEDLSRFGGNAQDILNNIPSVTVDVDGNVSLRGSSSVRILINGRQSGLVGISGPDALRQLPSNLVERVEVITNPSAKYDAEGMAGIINIVLKKEEERGLQGSFDLFAGYPHNYNAVANLNFRTNKLNFFGSYGFQYRDSPGSSYSKRYITEDDTTTLLIQDRTFNRKEFSHTLRLGLDYTFIPNNTITGSFLYRYGDGDNISDIYYYEYLGEDALTGAKQRRFEEMELEPNIDYTITYLRKFEGKDHQLTVDIDYTYGYEEEIADIDEFLISEEIPPNDPLLTQHSDLVETNDNLVLQADYSRPVLSGGRLELGYKSSIRNINNDYMVEEVQDGEWVELPGLTNQFNYDEDIHALYSTFGNKANNFSYQVGIRLEATRIITELAETGERADKDYNNLFPTGHFAYNLPRDNTIQISYSRRISRPWYRYLSPFYNYTDPYYIRTGNPDLDPEFTHALELSQLKNWNKASLSSAVYYRHTDGVIQRIQTVENDVTISRPENLSTEHSYGLEFIVSADPYKWWKLNGSANFFRSIVDGGNLDQQLQADTYSWFGRINSRIDLPYNVDFQLMFNYRAPYQTTQGRRNAYSYLDLALTRDVLHDRGTLSLRVSDLFNSRRYGGTTTGENFYIEQEYRRQVRQVTLGFSYRLNKEKNRGSGEERSGSGGGDMDF